MRGKGAGKPYYVLNYIDWAYNLSALKQHGHVYIMDNCAALSLSLSAWVTLAIQGEKIWGKLCIRVCYH